MAQRQPQMPPRPVGQLDTSAVRLPHFSWSAEDMGMKQFVSAAVLQAKTSASADTESNLQMLCRVTEGYQGCDLWHEFSSDELYWVRGIARQQRLVVADTQGRYLSIPYNYYRKFNASYDGLKFENIARTLANLRRDIVYGGLMTLQVENDEPVLVNIGSHGPSGFNEKLGALRVIDCYDEKYLVAHSIANGYVYSDPTIIPVYMPIAVTIAKSFDQKANVTSDFGEWMSDVGKIVAGFPRKEPQMCPEIVLFKQKPNSEYEYTMPTAFVVEMQRQSSVTDKAEPHYQRYVNIQSSVRQLDADASKSQLPLVKLRKCSTRRQPPPVPVKGNDYEVIDPSSGGATGRCTNSISSSGRSSKEQDAKQPRPTPPPHRTRDVYETIDDAPQPKGPTPPPPRIRDVYETIDDAPQPKGPTPPPPRIRDVYETIDDAPQPKGTGNHTNSAGNSKQSRPPPPIPESRDDYEIVEIVGRTNEKKTHIASVSNNDRSRSSPTVRDSESRYEKLDVVNDAGESGRLTDGISKNGGSKGQETKCTQMSVSELIEYLNRMKLGQYAGAIRSQCVDGRQLGKMSTKQLVSKLGFSEDHATVLQFMIRQDVGCL